MQAKVLAQDDSADAGEAGGADVGGERRGRAGPVGRVRAGGPFQSREFTEIRIRCLEREVLRDLPPEARLPREVVAAATALEEARLVCVPAVVARPTSRPA
jgi:hypothetical protein